MKHTLLAIAIAVSVCAAARADDCTPETVRIAPAPVDPLAPIHLRLPSKAHHKAPVPLDGCMDIEPKFSPIPLPEIPYAPPYGEPAPEANPVPRAPADTTYDIGSGATSVPEPVATNVGYVSNGGGATGYFLHSQGVGYTRPFAAPEISSSGTGGAFAILLAWTAIIRGKRK